MNSLSSTAFLLDYPGSNVWFSSYSFVIISLKNLSVLVHYLGRITSIVMVGTFLPHGEREQKNWCHVFFMCFFLVSFTLLISQTSVYFIIILQVLVISILFY